MVTDMTDDKRTTFEEAVESILDTVVVESPITIMAIADSTNVDWRAVERVIDFLMNTQEIFAAHEIRVMKSKAGKIVWMRDRLDKIRLPEEIREWYIKKRFFKKKEPDMSAEQISARFESASRTSVEEVIERLFIVLEIEDDLTVAELARRAGVNRKTVDRALDIITKFQEQIAKGIISKKDMIIWRLRPEIYDLDSTIIKYLLKKWYFPDEVEELPEEQEKALLLTS